MHIRKSIKNILIISLLLSSITTNSKIKAGAGEVIASFVVGAGIVAITGGLIALQTYVAYKRGQEQYEVLREFHQNPYITYENLTQDARNLYYNQCGSSSTCVESDYPVIWLERDATANKNLLAWMFFNKKLVNLSVKLARVLNYLRSVQRFQLERREFNQKYREEKYREERLALEREKVQLQKELAT